MVCILQIASNAGAEIGLQSDVLLRALQKTADAGIEIVFPGQEMHAFEVQLIAGCGRAGAAAGGQPIPRPGGPPGPAFAQVINLCSEAVLGVVISLGIDDA